MGNLMTLRSAIRLLDQGAKRGANGGRSRATQRDVPRQSLQVDCPSGDFQRRSGTVRLRLKSEGRQVDHVPDHNNFLGDQSALSAAQTAGREGFQWRCQRSSLSSLTCGTLTPGCVRNRGTAGREKTMTI